MYRYITDVQESYDQVAEEYGTRFFHELEHKPLDCELLNRFVKAVQGSVPVADIGCGPGQVTRYLSERGANVLGVDLSPHMVEQARKCNPGIEFRQGNMASLDVDDESWAGIVAFYSIIHIPREQVVSVLQEFRRVLKLNGLLLLSFHQGEETVHLDEWWGKKVSLDFEFFQCNEMETYLTTAGFLIEDRIERPPYEEVEVQTKRAYLFARKPQ